MADGVSSHTSGTVAVDLPSPPRRQAVACSPTARDVLMLVNRKAGRRGGKSRAKVATEAAQAAGFLVEQVESPDELAAKSRARLASGDLRAVVAVGGDGTVGLALNSTPPGTPLAVVPAGTENLLAKYLGSCPRPAELGQLISSGVKVKLDAGRANGRLFTLMISAGFDAEVVRRVHATRRGNITHLAYAAPILQALQRYQYPPLHASWTDEAGVRQEQVGRWLFGVNLPRYAQDLPIVPEADGADGLLDLCLFERGGMAAGLWYLWHVIRRRREKLTSVSASQLTQFRIASPVENVAYQLDGDPGGILPVDVSVVPERLTLLVAPTTATKLGFAVPVPAA
ncbi:MAG: diacylglycerol kinase family protein [Planctomycetota bacterium]